MPRLSLYRPEKSKDYKFIDRTIYEQFQVGGVDVYVHKYIGPQDPSDPSKALGETTIQDVLFLENRDRKYDTDVYTLRGHYQTSDIDFNLSQFGLFLQNDTVFMTVHINNSVDLIGRKIMSGDVFELPNLKDEYALNDFKSALKRFYVVEDVNRAAEGFSAVWYPHLYRLKLKPIVDSQEFRDILNRPENVENFAGDWVTGTTYYPGQIVRYAGNLYTVTVEATDIQPPNASYYDPYTDNTLRDIMSTYEKEMQINDAVLLEAESDAALSGFETSHLYTLATDASGRTELVTVDETDINVADGYNVSEVSPLPMREGYSGYLLEDGIPPNGSMSPTAQFGFGIQFPSNPDISDTFLRTDYLPNRLFRYDGTRWVKQEDNVRMTLSNTDTRQTLKTSFINNTEFSGIGKIATDVVNVNANGDPSFTAGVTTAFTIDVDSLTITTNVPYVATYKVEAWLSETAKATDITTSNSSGSLAFTIGHALQPNTRIRYTVYEKVVEQRQAVSKAIRKIKPVADG